MSALPIVLHVITPARILLAVINVVVEKDLNFMKEKRQNIIILSDWLKDSQSE